MATGAGKGRPLNSFVSFHFQMLTDKNLAIAAIRLSEAYLIGLNLVLAEVQQNCSDAEFQAFRRAVGLSMGKVDLELLDPLYKAHPELEPEGHKLDPNES